MLSFCRSLGGDELAGFVGAEADGPAGHTGLQSAYSFEGKLGGSSRPFLPVLVLTCRQAKYLDQLCHINLSHASRQGWIRADLWHGASHQVQKKQ
jgi:hypothetical protein